MALKTKYNETIIGVGDIVIVKQEIIEGEKQRLQSFEGMIIGIKGRDMGKSITVRRIGTAQIGIEKIFPLFSPSVKDIEVVRHGYTGAKQAKLYYTRDKSKREIDLIYSRASRRNQNKKDTKARSKSKSPKKTVSKKSSKTKSTAKKTTKKK